MGEYMRLLLKTFLSSCLILISANCSYAFLSEEAYALSGLIRNSDLIICGTVTEVEESSNEYRSLILVDEILLGNRKLNSLIVISPLANDLFIPDESYPLRNNRYIFFLKQNSGHWIFANSGAGLQTFDIKDDLTMLIAKYEENNEIFYSQFSNELINLFYVSKSKKMKDYLLIDLEKSVTALDEKFLLELLDASDKSYIRFAVNRIGKLKLKHLKNNIERLLKPSQDNELVFCVIDALKEIGDGESIVLLISYLDYNDQPIRRITIEALGEIGDPRIVTPLKNAYVNETDILNRLANVEAICLLANAEIKYEALNYFLTRETDPFLSSFIEKKLYK
jgi:hypothetical protein